MAAQRANLKDNGETSIRNGFWFYFNDGDDQIVAHGCGHSGKETVYLNDKVISSKRVWGLTGLHPFRHNGHHYRIKMRVCSVLNHSIECQLERDHQPFARQVKALVEPGSPSQGVSQYLVKPAAFGLIVGAGAMLGYIAI
ncbi:hypothetical protein [Ferrimonas senticii]|uniref:hypothetical protein n=1 Tax=Ferrimonas senticii TaxID=394566 RepID=UPI000413E17B|nr:hypothetical protein [Ferrimonas senticii]